MTGLADAVRWLLDRSHLLDPTDLPAAVDDAARRLGASGAVVYLIDRDQRTLVPLGREDRVPLSVEATLPGRAFQLTEIHDSAVDDQPRLWIPLLDGAERLGVVELLCSAEQTRTLREDAQVLISLVAELVISRSAYTDVYDRARATTPMTLAAELLWQQLRPTTVATERFVIAAALEPVAQVGGDAYDYAIDGDTVHLAVLDGMGHGLRATLLTSVALAAYRTSRRAGAGLRDIAVSMDQAIAEHFGADSFVTALLAQLDVLRGTLAILSAGHPPPLLLREGKIIGSVETEPGPPLGIGLRDDAIAELSLQPGDTLLLYTDGVVEARTPDGEFFGLQRLADFLARQAASQLPPPEVLRRLMDAILEHQKSDLQDDATCVLLEWAGASPGQFDLARQAAG
jgi:hypothetical protein